MIGRQLLFIRDLTLRPNLLKQNSGSESRIQARLGKVRRVRVRPAAC